MKKTAKDFLDAANSQIDHISVAEAKQKTDAIFVDVRSKADFDAGHIDGAIHAERGLLEFFADSSHPMAKHELHQGKELIVYCNLGGQSALSTKLMQDMGIKNVKNITGGMA